VSPLPRPCASIVRRPHEQAEMRLRRRSVGKNQRAAIPRPGTCRDDLDVPGNTHAPLDWTGTVGERPGESIHSLVSRHEHHVAAVGRPGDKRTSVGPGGDDAPERTTNLGDGDVSAAVWTRHDTTTIGRNAYPSIGLRRQRQRLFIAAPVDPDQPLVARRRSAGPIHECSIRTDGVVHDTGKPVPCSVNPCRHQHRLARGPTGPEIERDGHQLAHGVLAGPRARCVHQVTGRHIPRVAPAVDHDRAFA
jgi:hypothetical protein